jgi:hypothetical protein
VFFVCCCQSSCLDDRVFAKAHDIVVTQYNYHNSTRHTAAVAVVGVVWRDSIVY